MNNRKERRLLAGATMIFYGCFKRRGSLIIKKANTLTILILSWLNKKTVLTLVNIDFWKRNLLKIEYVTWTFFKSFEFNYVCVES